jgi:DNA primase
VQLPQSIVEKKNIPLPSITKALEGEMQERELIRLLLKFGNNIIESDMHEGAKNIKIVTVAQFIVSEIEHDELEFQHPVYKKIYDEYAYFINRSIDAEPKYFTQHPDQEINAVAADLLSNKYTLSKNLFEKGAHVYIETEDMKLGEIVPAVVIDFKSKKIMASLRETQMQLLDAQKENDVEKIEELQLRIQNLNVLKKTFNKRLGNRTIVH